MPPRGLARMVAAVAAGAAACMAGCARPAPVTPAPPPAPARASAPLAERPALPLWPAGAPGAVGDSAADRPTITPYLPAPGTATGAAAIVFPGGGYVRLAVEKEGVPTARWLTASGVTTFVVRYRLGPRYHHPTMLQDAQRAVRTVRARAAEWGVDTARIAVVGFSAGGHMASTAGTHFDAGRADAGDPVERASSRPDLMILAYPVITMDPRWAHRGSRAALLGNASDSSATARLMSNETQVTPRTPPTFLVASTDDASVPVENTVMFYQALRAAGVPAELHVFESGRHGFGLAVGDPVLSSWVPQATAWLRRHGWLDARSASAAAS